MPPGLGKSSRKPPKLTYRQRQAAREVATAHRRAINDDVDEVLTYMDKEAKKLSIKHKHTEAWFLHQFYQGGRVVRQKRAPGVCNAARQVDGFLEGKKGDITEQEREQFLEIKMKLKQLNGVENASKLPTEMKDFLIEKTKGWRDKKHTGVRANTRAVVQDARLTLERIRDELMALTARTDIQTFLFAVKGKPEHTIPAFVVASEKAGRYLLHGMKRHSADIVKEFESYVLGDVEGLILNHNGRVADIKSKIRTDIREGLAAITGDAKTTMQYDRYEKCIVVDKGIRLINWPGDIPFVNASEIGSLHTLRRLLAALTHDDVEQRCRWVNLSEEEWEARKEVYYKAEAETEPRTRKRKKKTLQQEDSGTGETSEDERPAKRTRQSNKGKAKENDAPATAKGKEKENAAPATAKGTKKGRNKGAKGKGAEKSKKI